MDVTCEKCGAEYEFDESLLGERGATVKCSSCTHVFRVFAKAAPAKPALKLRFARTGRIETLSSLRELQLRIRNGDVNGDDQLGRDGVGFRRLADVPELKNFFVRPTAPGSTLLSAQAPLKVSETSMPPTSKDNPAQAATAPGNPNPKRTVLGMGPLHPHIPPPPRVPNVPGALPAPSARAVSEPPRRVPPTPAVTISSIPTAPPPAARAPVELAATRGAPISNQPTAPQARAPQLPAMLMASEAPAIARPAGNTPRTLDGASGAPVKLYLSDDEAPPARAVQAGGKGWLYALLAVALGVVGWFGMSALNKSEQAQAPVATAATPPPPAAQPVPVPSAPANTPTTAPSAPAPTGAGAGAAPVPAATTPTPSPMPAAPAAQAEPESTPAAKPRPSASDRPEPARERSGRNESQPSDYGGWVTRGDQQLARGDLAGARSAYESALKQRATGSEANTGLGFSLLADGRARDALLYLDRAASSGYAEAYIGLGDAYRKLGQKANAIEAYETYLARLPTGSKAKYARTQVLGLKGNGDESAPAAAPAEETSAPRPGPSDEYRPAGELTAPAPEAPAAEAPAEPSGEGAP